MHVGVADLGVQIELRQHADAAAIYDALAKQPDLADGYIGAISLRSGANQEDAGDYVKALACYQLAEKDVDTGDKAREAVLRAAFIQFDNGNKTEAFRLVNVLAHAAQKGKMKTSEQVRDVIVLAGDGASPPPFWDNWQVWWPQWQQLETAGGLDPVKDHKIIPIIPNLVDFGKDLASARNAKDTKHFFELMRQVAYAARFYPNATQEFVGIFSLGEEMLPDHANDFRLLAIAMLEPLSTNDPAAQRQRMLNLLVNYVDTNQNDKALALMAKDWKPNSTTVPLSRCPFIVLEQWRLRSASTEDDKLLLRWRTISRPRRRPIGRSSSAPSPIFTSRRGARTTR